MLLDFGCALDGDVAITTNNIRFDIADAAKVAVHIGEIMVNGTYNVCCKDDAAVIDIGMNRGVASLFFAAQENVKAVYAFEPFTPTLTLAQKNLGLNPELSKKIRTFACGLGRDDRMLQIPYSVNSSDSMSTTHTVRVKKNVHIETVAVKDAAAQLSPILEENKNRRMIVKCDCEGAEFEILERLSEKRLVDKIDVFLMEYHFKEPDSLVRILMENGFAVHVTQGSRDPIVGYLYAVKMPCCKK